jgi:hypothetical protein
VNGKGEWFRFVGGLVLAGLVGYFSAQSALQTRVAVLESRMDTLIQEVRYLRSAMERGAYR